MECSILKTNSNGIVVPVELLPYKSIVWEECWQKSGSAQVVFSKTDYVLDSVKVGRWIGLDITKRIMYIHSVKVTETEVWAYGYEAKEMLAKCALLQQAAAGTVDIATAMETVITNNCPYSWLGTVSVYISDTANLDSLEYLSLADYVAECANLKKLGYYIARNTVTGKLDFRAQQGTDKTDKVHFATTLGNANDIKYTYSDKSYCNVVYAIGENNIVESASESSITGETYSAILDLRDSFPQDTMTTANYRAALQNRAYMSLIARHNTEKIEIGSIDTSEFGSTYGLGDIISIDIPELYLSTSRRVIAAKYTVEGGNIKLKLTLSEV